MSYDHPISIGCAEGDAELHKRHEHAGGHPVSDLVNRWLQRRAKNPSWNIAVGDRFVVKVSDMKAFHRRTVMRGEKSEPATLPAIIPEGMGIRVTGVAESWNEIEFKTSDMCSVPDPERKITIRTGFGFFASPEDFARAVGLSTVKIEAYSFKMHNLPGEPWKTYYVLPQHTTDDEMAFSSLPPNELQYQAEHIMLTAEEFERQLEEGSIVSADKTPNAPQTVEQVKTVDPDEELSRLIDLKNEGKITPEQFQDKAKRLFGCRSNWMIRRAQDWLAEYAPKVYASYMKDRSMGLDHSNSIDHVVNNWRMVIDMRRSQAGLESVSDAEATAIRQRLVDMIQENGGSVPPQAPPPPPEPTIAHAMPEATPAALWRVHLAKAKSNPAYEKETAVIRENKKKPEARRIHDFKAAKWTHPNGHPRCIICGGEERTSGQCNVDPTVEDREDLPKPSREKLAQALSEQFDRGEITYADMVQGLAHLGVAK